MKYLFFFIVISKLSIYAMEMPIALPQQKENQFHKNVAGALRAQNSYSDEYRVSVMGEYTNAPFFIESASALKALSLSSKGEIERTNTSGNHPVKSLDAIHVKANDPLIPLNPGMEIAMYLFYTLLFCDQELLSISSLLTFQNLPFSLTDTVAQISQTVTGESFTNFLANVHAGRASFDQLNSANISAHLVCSMLTNPSDYKPGNFMVRNICGECFLIGIDNDMALAYPVVRTNDVHNVGVKNILYFIKSLMLRPIDGSVRERIIRVDAEKLVLDWLQALAKKNNQYEQLLLNKCISREVYDKLSLPIKLVPGTATTLLQTLKKMQAILCDRPQITHQGLLEELQPLVAMCYQAIGMASNSPEEAYLKINSQAPIKDVQVAQPLEDILPLDQYIQGERLFKKLRREKNTGSDYETKRTQIISLAIKEIEELKQKEEGKALRRTPLHDAILLNKNNEQQVIAELEKYVPTISIDTCDNQACSPLDYSIEHGLENVFQYLIRHGAGTKVNYVPAISFYQNSMGRNSSSPQLKDALVVLKNRNPEFAFKLLLNSIILEASNGSSKKIYSSSKTGYLDRAIHQQLWNSDGIFIKANVYGRRDLGKAIIGQHSLWFKKMHGLPGFEAAIQELIHDSIEHGAPYSELIHIDDEPFLVSLDVDAKGKNLRDLFKAHPDVNPPELQKLDPTSTSKMIIMALLTNPEDGKDDNYIVQELLINGQKKFRLVCVDNEHSLIPALARNKKTKAIEHKVKCILFCLDQINEAILQEVIDFFIQQDPHEIITNWLKKLSRIHKSHFAMLGHRAKELKDRDCFIGIPFTKGMINRLYEKWMRLRRILYKRKHDSHFSHLDLMHELEPALYSRYAGVLQQKIHVNKRFLLINGALYSHKDGTIISTTKAQDILQSQNIPLEVNLIDALGSNSAIGPDQGLSELAKAEQEFPQQEPGSLSATFAKLSTPEQKENYVNSLDFEKITDIQQKELFEQANRDKVEWTKLMLRNAHALTNRTLIEQLDIRNLRKLNLAGCQQITDDVIPLLAELSISLEYLDLSEIHAISTVGCKEHLIGPATKITGSLGIMLGLAFAPVSAIMAYINLLNGEDRKNVLKDFIFSIASHFWTNIPKYFSLLPILRQRLNLDPGIRLRLNEHSEFTNRIREMYNEIERLQKIKPSLANALNDEMRNALDKAQYMIQLDKGYKSRTSHVLFGAAIGLYYFILPSIASIATGLLVDQAHRRLTEKKLLEFPSLKTLITNNCTRLRTITISCSELIRLESKNCPNLANLLLKTSSLHTLDLRKNAKITDRILDTILAHSSKLSELRLQECADIHHIKIREAAPHYPINLLNNVSKDSLPLILSLLNNTFSEKSLDLSQVSATDANAILKVCETNGTLTSLNIGALQISDKTKKAINDRLERNRRFMQEYAPNDLLVYSEMPKEYDPEDETTNPLLQLLTPKKNILFGLAIDSGDMAGLIAVLVLHELEKHTKNRIYELFDCISGSGSGGLIALGLSASEDGQSPLLTSEKLIKLFQKRGVDFFSCASKRSKPPHYPAHYYEKIMRACFKDSILSDALTRVVIPCINQDTRVSLIFDRETARKKETEDYSMRELARASWADPEYLGASKIEDITHHKQKTVIASNIIHANPALLVYKRLRNLNPHAKIYILSLGSGKLINPTQVQPSSRLVGMAINSRVQNTDTSLELREKLAEKYIRHEPNFENQIDPYDISAETLDEYGRKAAIIAKSLLEGNDVFMRLLLENKKKKLPVNNLCTNVLNHCRRTHFCSYLLHNVHSKGRSGLTIFSPFATKNPYWHGMFKLLLLNSGDISMSFSIEK